MTTSGFACEFGTCGSWSDRVPFYESTWVWMVWGLKKLGVHSPIRDEGLGYRGQICRSREDERFNGCPRGSNCACVPLEFCHTWIMTGIEHTVRINDGYTMHIYSINRIRILISFKDDALRNKSHFGPVYWLSTRIGSILNQQERARYRRGEKQREMHKKIRENGAARGERKHVSSPLVQDIGNHSKGRENDRGVDLSTQYAEA